MRLRGSKAVGPLVPVLLAVSVIGTSVWVARARGWSHRSAELAFEAPEATWAERAGGETLDVNGVRFRVEHGRVGQGRRSAVDAIAAECQAEPIVVEDEEQAYVVCPTVGEVRGRAAYVRGTTGPALVLALDTASPSELERMFPTRGDVPGGDLHLVARPRGARRVLVVHARETGHRAVGYRVARPLGPVVREMQDRLRDDGWSVTTGSRRDRGVVLRAQRLHRSVDVVVLEEGAHSSVTAWETADER